MLKINHIPMVGAQSIGVRVRTHQTKAWQGKLELVPFYIGHPHTKATVIQLWSRFIWACSNSLVMHEHT